MQQWVLCFSDNGVDVSARIRGCDVALMSRNLSTDDVSRLTARRAFLRVERELEIDRLRDQSILTGKLIDERKSGSSAPEGNAAPSDASSLRNSREALLEEPLNRDFLVAMTEYIIFYLTLIALDALQRLWRRLKVVQADATSNASVDYMEPAPAVTLSLTEGPSGQPFKEVLQSNLNFSGWKDAKETIEPKSNVFTQAEAICKTLPLAGGGAMQLRLRRSQRSGGVVSSKVYFALDARADLSAEEKGLVSKYGLGKLVVYDSQARKQHQEAAYGHFDEASVSSSAGRGWWKNARGIASAAMMALSLRITVDGLMNGQHIECKDLDELLGAEAAILNACKSLRAYLDTAQTFDGREEVLEL
ncbi:hypothetical protein QA635_39195 [Bradyrhizobium brasilense]|uniref:hypothetical protein n=1 Tax=Bradyrhizobium brasilense TaxID=1419277 RepID=UPI0024B1631B|nr:hypothetical protein [Bradyrhizobium australafricanum]WFU32437.1 hypothetical protein QA635_39195 [Bradyrhizobium australafricanum]